jgi:hypothetical protein
MVSPGSATTCECGLVFGSTAMDRATAAKRRQRFFDLRQQAAGMFIGLFVGGVLGPLLIVSDREHAHRGLILVAFAAVMFVWGAIAWFQLPKDQRTWKALRSPR